jgi:hypothetical protein
VNRGDNVSLGEKPLLPLEFLDVLEPRIHHSGTFSHVYTTECASFSH